MKDSDLELQWFKGNIGAGGQHRNKHACSLRLIHKPTGTMAVSQGRDRPTNLKLAREALEKKLKDNSLASFNTSRQADIKTKMGSGERGDKIRTYRFQDDRVKNHLNGKECATSKVMKGFIDLLWD